MKFTPRMLALLLLLCLPLNGLCETTSTFEARTMETDAQPALRCWLYTPSEPAENLPLIVYLHGGSGKGDDLNLLTDVDGFPRFLQTGKLGDLRAYVVMPKHPRLPHRPQHGRNGRVEPCGREARVVFPRRAAFGQHPLYA